jgi:hypothetical protein
VGRIGTTNNIPNQQAANLLRTDEIQNPYPSHISLPTSPMSKIKNPLIPPKNFKKKHIS